MDETIVKNGEVEVTSEEVEGFKEAWYRAILEEDPTKSVSEKLKVRYLTLLNDDGSASLTGMIDRRFIRPVPPENPYDDVFLKEGSVVDADLKGGWWVGLVIKKIEDGEKYLVYFDSPPDIIPFKRRQLKAHFDWTGSEWVRPKIKKLVKSVFSSGEMVELREDLKWREVMIVKALGNEKRFIVKKSENQETVDSVRVRPVQPPSLSIREYELLDRVEVFRGFVWSQGVVKGILSERRYVVSFVETKEEERFNRSDLRPLMEWKDGVWDKRVIKGKSKKVTPSEGKRNKSDVVLNDAIATPVRQKKAQGKTFNKKTLEPVKNRNESTREKMCEEHYSRKRKTKAGDTKIASPFTKKSSVWKIYESMEVFKRVPQTPHFSPLIETKEDFREGFALGMMATFTLLLEKLKDLKSDVPISQLESLKDSFSELEKHGFNIAAPLSRIDKLLAMKNRQLSLSEELKGFEKEKIDESSKMRKAEEDIDEIEHKIFELRRQRVVRYGEKKSAYEKICQKESCARDVGAKLKNVESEFETTVSAPW